MRGNDVLNGSDFYDQILEEDKNLNISNPCDPSHPDYPWVPCGIKMNENNK
ncbi:hypothetical protein ACQPU1_08825 [Clostridium paraputrificum]|uniref:hypothetical protein n=1 Tax=Clostridium TaxID=1485 RepID=UPI003D33F263